MVPTTVQTFMGAFIDAAKEQDFAGRTFSSLFDVHIGLLMVGFGAVAWLVVGMPDEPTLNEQWGQSVEKVWLLMWSSMIFCRVALHLVMKEPAKSQRLGSRFWTVYVVSELIADIAGNAARPSNDCPISGGEGCVALLSFAKAVLNGTQGMRFWHKTALVYLMVVDGALLFGGICGAQGVPSQRGRSHAPWATSYTLDATFRVHAPRRHRGAPHRAATPPVPHARRAALSRWEAQQQRRRAFGPATIASYPLKSLPRRTSYLVRHCISRLLGRPEEQGSRPNRRPGRHLQRLQLDRARTHPHKDALCSCVAFSAGLHLPTP